MTPPASRIADWQGHRVVTIGDALTQVAVVPGRGGKIVSLRHAGFEWLAQGCADRCVAPGAGFVDAEMCGADDCAPTITACTVASGRELPDHGDLWNQPWQVGDHTPTSLTLVVDHPSWPGRLRRTISLDAGQVRLDYQVDNVGQEPVAYLWAWHPQFRGDHFASASIDAGQGLVDGLVPGAPDMPTTTITHFPDAGACAKFWSERTARATGAHLVRDDGHELSLHWSPDGPIRWAGIWLDAGAYAPGYVVALEPSTGWFDDTSAAASNDSVLWLEPGAQAQWTLTVTMV